jgi:hypothetical protein
VRLSNGIGSGVVMGIFYLASGTWLKKKEDREQDRISRL